MAANDRPNEELPLRFLFDVDVHLGACRELRRRGIDVVHAVEAGLAEVADPALLEHAIEEGRIVVTRNYARFVKLSTAYVRQGRSFPGILFYAPSVALADVRAHVLALEAWIAQAPADPNPVADTWAWLT